MHAKQTLALLARFPFSAEQGFCCCCSCGMQADILQTPLFRPLLFRCAFLSTCAERCDGIPTQPVCSVACVLRLFDHVTGRKGGSPITAKSACNAMMKCLLVSVLRSSMQTTTTSTQAAMPGPQKPLQTQQTKGHMRTRTHTRWLPTTLARLSPCLLSFLTTSVPSFPTLI